MPETILATDRKPVDARHHNAAAHAVTDAGLSWMSMLVGTGTPKMLVMLTDGLPSDKLETDRKFAQLKRASVTVMMVLIGGAIRAHDVSSWTSIAAVEIGSYGPTYLLQGPNIGQHTSHRIQISANIHPVIHTSHRIRISATIDREILLYIHLYTDLHVSTHVCIHMSVDISGCVGTHVHVRYIHVHIHVHTCAHMCTHVHTCAYMCIHVHTCAYMCTHVHTCAYMCIHVHTCAHMCIHVHTCAYMCTHVHTCAHMCIHVHTCAYMCIHVHTCACCAHGACAHTTHAHARAHTHQV